VPGRPLNLPVGTAPVFVCVCLFPVFTPGPGPAVYQDRRQTYRGMYNSPAYTMRCLCMPKPPFVTPGPPTYRYEDYPPYLETRAPIYTMAARTRYPLVTSYRSGQRILTKGRIVTLSPLSGEWIRLTLTSSNRPT